MSFIAQLYLYNSTYYIFVNQVNNSMDIIKHLRSKPLVHIISEPRSGSNSLYWCLKHNTVQNKELSVKFWHQNSAEHKNTIPNRLNKNEQLELAHNNVSGLCGYINHNLQQSKVIKNHLVDMQDYSLRDQQRLWQLPAYKVGLSRRNLFQQVLSRCLAKLTGIYHIDESLGDHMVPKTIAPEFFLDHLAKVSHRKQELHKHKLRFHQFIYYEDIVFPAHMDQYKFPDKSITVSNIAELEQLYQKHKA